MKTPSERQYRIVTNGTRFKVQCKGWFFWHDVGESNGFCTVTLFSTIDRAEECLKKSREVDIQNSPHWEPVRGK